MTTTKPQIQHANRFFPSENDLVFCTPRVYDTAFDWGVERELDLLCSQVLGLPRGPLCVLVPASGTGRFAEGLANLGHHVIAFDIHPAMVEFARTNRCPQNVEYFVGDMRTAPVGRDSCFDVGFLLCSSFRYLLSYHDALKHLRCIEVSLKPGGKYVIDMGMNFRQAHVGQPIRWTVDGDTCVAHASWILESLDPPRAVDDVQIDFLNKTTGERVTLREKQAQFVWEFDAFEELVSKTALTIGGVFTPDGILAPDPSSPSRYYIVLEKP